MKSSELKKNTTSLETLKVSLAHWYFKDMMGKKNSLSTLALQKLKEKLIGKSVTEVFPGVKEFGLFDVFQRVYKTGTPEHHPISIYKDERIAGWRENYVYKLPSGRIVAVYDDISSLKRTELVTKMTDQCFRAIADYSYDWEVWISPNGRMLWTNPAATRITGYSIKEIMAMKDYPDSVVYQDDRRKISKAFHSALEGASVTMSDSESSEKTAW